MNIRHFNHSHSICVKGIIVSSRLRLKYSQALVNITTFMHIDFLNLMLECEDTLKRSFAQISNFTHILSNIGDIVVQWIAMFPLSNVYFVLKCSNMDIPTATHSGLPACLSVCFVH